MSRSHRLPITTLAVVAALPLAWLACGGGESKPPETAAGESSSASSEAPAASDAPAAAESASAAPAADTAPAASATSDSTASAPPPSPSLGSTDCGKCIDKTCAKQEAACAKNSDCQSTLDGIHGCSSGAASCLDSATEPTTAKPKKLAGAYQACAKKAVASKACKAKCE
jgi:hypothetical protein